MKSVRLTISHVLCILEHLLSVLERWRRRCTEEIPSADAGLWPLLVRSTLHMGIAVVFTRLYTHRLSDVTNNHDTRTIKKCMQKNNNFITIIKYLLPFSVNMT